jgi:hypothetical protein
MNYRPPAITYRALNRAMLERQMLLARDARPAIDAIRHLVGMQSQAPNAPYVGLWSRLAGFAHDELSELVTSRQVVRISCLRGTIHLVTADDAALLRPLTQVVLTRAIFSQAFGKNLAGLDLEPVLATARELAAERPRTRTEVAKLLAERWPGWDATSLGYAFTYLVPLIQVPPRGIWGRTGPIAWTPAEDWLRRDLDPDPEPDEVMLRYLAAFGPATVADVQAWSGLTRLREVAERLRPRLRTFTDPAGAEVLDLPDAPLPDEDADAPPRFLPEYDNVLFSYADRTRVNPNRNEIPLAPGNGGRCGTVLIDGTFRATWQITVAGDQATLLIKPFAPLASADQADVVTEGAGLLAFAAADATSHDVQVLSP